MNWLEKIVAAKGDEITAAKKRTQLTERGHQAAVRFLLSVAESIGRKWIGFDFAQDPPSFGNPLNRNCPSGVTPSIRIWSKSPCGCVYAGFAIAR